MSEEEFHLSKQWKERGRMDTEFRRRMQLVDQQRGLSGKAACGFWFEQHMEMKSFDEEQLETFGSLAKSFAGMIKMANSKSGNI